MKAAMHAQMNQTIGMTPQLLQSIRLLHLNAMEVEQEVARALEENPLLERVEGDADAADDNITGDEKTQDEDVRAEDAAAVEDFDDYVPGEFSAAIPSDLDRFENVGASETGGVRGRIRAQLALELTDAATFAAACWIVDHTDDNGYLELPRDELIAQAQQQFGLGADAIEAIRQRILHCEPTGFGARDLRECLLAQLGEMGGEVDGLELAVRIVREHLDRLALRDNAALAAALGVSVPETDEAVRVILALDPKPGSCGLVAEDTAIIPDIVVRRGPNGWHAALNARGAPRVRVDAQTERLLSQSS
ncbi:MAG TPA: RNA polymerase sigma-54 factor, partial [Rudaea sp.]